MKRRPLVLIDGKVTQLGSGDSLNQVELSGVSVIDEPLEIPTNFQMINFTMLTIDEDLTLDGDLWLA